jgi:DNA repair exonuclease SbcCD ATPase subunit
MKQIKKIQLVDITLDGFKIFRDLVNFKFDENISLIEGKNRQGKSSILEAIVYAFTGCTFWGDNKTEKLINRKLRKMQVSVKFKDDTGMLHTITRARTRAYAGTSISLDGITVSQSFLYEILGGKDVMISIMNPLYFIEKMADTNGREFLQRLLPATDDDEIMAALSEENRMILTEQCILDPVTYIKNRRKEIKELEDNRSYNEGCLDTLRKKAETPCTGIPEIDEKIRRLRAELEKMEQDKPSPLDTSVLESKKTSILSEIRILQDKAPVLEDTSQLELKEAELKGKLEVLKSRKYVSGLVDIISSIDDSIADIQKECDRLSKLVKTLSPGSSCPVCLNDISSVHFKKVTVHVKKEMKVLADRAEPLKKRREWLVHQDNESSNNFNERVARDIQEFEREIFETRKSIQEVKLSNISKSNDFKKSKKAEIIKLKADIDRIEKQISSQKSSYSQAVQEHQKKVSSRKDIIFKDIEVLQLQRSSITDAEKLAGEIKKTEKFIEDIDKSIKTANYKINAAMEYAAKRAEISLKPLKMKKVNIKLHELVKSTGEIINTFKFIFEEGDYKTLSLSEKIEAGLEVSALIGRLSGKEYPVLVDNIESITSSDYLEELNHAVFVRARIGADIKVDKATKDTLPEEKAFKEAV